MEKGVELGLDGIGREGESVELTKLTDKEIIKLLNLLLMGMGSEYYVQWFGYTGLKDKDDKEKKVTIRE